MLVSQDLIYFSSILEILDDFRNVTGYLAFLFWAKKKYIYTPSFPYNEENPVKAIW